MTDDFNVFDELLRYEEDGMAEEDEIRLFQHLVDTGMAWTLQGHYGRTAKVLIEAGLVLLPPPKQEE